jgi:hypothetical protein
MRVLRKFEGENAEKMKKNERKRRKYLLSNK